MARQFNSDPAAPVRVCLLGQDPLGTTLSRMMADHLSRGRSLLLRRVMRTDPVSDCQILYISASEGKFIPQIIAQLKNSSILTVGENEQFAQEGGMIQLVLSDKQIRFKINPAAVSQAGLHISSKLLALAQIVGPLSHVPPPYSGRLAGETPGGLLLNSEAHGLYQNSASYLD